MNITSTCAQMQTVTFVQCIAVIIYICMYTQLCYYYLIQVII